MTADRRTIAGHTLIAAFAVLCTESAAHADCDEYLTWPEAERRAFLDGWITGTAMITSDLRLNIYSKRIQLAVEERQPCSGSNCEIVSRAGHAIQKLKGDYRNVLLASRHRDDFYSAINEYCESPGGPGTSLSEAIPSALGNMAYSGRYSLLEFGIVLNGEERIAEMYSSQYVGGTLSGGRSVRASSLSALCETKANPVFLQGQKTVTVSVGEEFGLDEIHVDAFDQNGNFVRGVPLRVREIGWFQNFKLVQPDYDQRYVKYRALQPGEIVLEAISLCPQDPVDSWKIRLVIAES